MSHLSILLCRNPQNGHTVVSLHVDDKGVMLVADDALRIAGALGAAAEQAARRSAEAKYGKYRPLRVWRILKLVLCGYQLAQPFRIYDSELA